MAQINSSDAYNVLEVGKDLENRKDNRVTAVPMLLWAISIRDAKCVCVCVHLPVCRFFWFLDQASFAAADADSILNSVETIIFANVEMDSEELFDAIQADSSSQCLHVLVKEKYMCVIQSSFTPLDQDHQNSKRRKQKSSVCVLTVFLSQVAANFTNPSPDGIEKICNVLASVVKLQTSTGNQTAQRAAKILRSLLATKPQSFEARAATSIVETVSSIKSFFGEDYDAQEDLEGVVSEVADLLLENMEDGGFLEVSTGDISLEAVTTVTTCSPKRIGMLVVTL